MSYVFFLESIILQLSSRLLADELATFVSDNNRLSRCGIKFNLSNVVANMALQMPTAMIIYLLMLSLLLWTLQVT